MSDSIFIGAGGEPMAPQNLLLKRANRHGLVAGATGTGKTVTLQVLAEGFSRAGVPVFAADVKTDLSGIACGWEPSAPFQKRAEMLGIAATYKGEATPTVFWDLYGQKGHPIRATISEMGPTLLARLMDLSEAQEGVLAIAFKKADTEKLLLIDLKDLKALLDDMAENAAAVSKEYGLVTPQSIAAVQRNLLQLEAAGADNFFGEPALELADFLRTDLTGRGIVNILAADRLITSPALYATFLLWLLSELFEQMPEVGDPEKPRLVFFFDEAHLLFRDAPKALLNTIEQVVRLIRSKGVGVYFVTQNPQDIPESVLAQLGNRIQHALRAYTPSEAKAVRVAADSFRPNPRFKTEDAITELGVGEALVSVLDEKGAPTVVERTFIRPPVSRVGPASDEERARVMQASPVAMKYTNLVDRESAFEILQKKALAAEQEMAAAKAAEEQFMAEAKAAKEAQQAQRQAPRATTGGGGILDGLLGGNGRRQGVVETTVKSMARQVGSQLTRELMRGLLGGLKRR